MARLVPDGYEDFLGGMVSSVKANELNRSQLALAQNVICTLRTKMGQCSKRLGRTAHYTGGATSGTGIVNIHNFIKHDGTEQLLYAYDNGTDIQIRQRTGASASTLVYTGSGLTGKETSIYTAPTDFCIIAIGSGTYQKYDGSTTATINPPATMTTGVSVEHQGRLWGTDITTKNKLWYSAIMDEDDWTTANNAGSFLMRMPNITGIVSCGDAGLIVCSEYQTAVIDGNGVNSYIQRSLSTKWGCKSYKSMVSFGNYCLFLAHDDVLLANSSSIEKVGGAVRDKIDSMTEAAKLGAKAFGWEEFYILCYDSDADGTVDTALVYDTRYKDWQIWTNHSIVAGTRSKDSTYYVAIQGTDNLDKYWDSYGDRGSGIAVSVTSRGYDWGRFFSRKTARKLYIESATPGSSVNVAVQIIADGSNVGSTENYDLSSKEGSVTCTASGTGNILQFNVSNTSTDGPIDLTSFLFLANEMPATTDVLS
jgi:hypothetical protein